MENVVPKEPEEPETFPEKHIGANLPAPFIILGGTIIYVALLVAAKVYEVRHQAIQTQELDELKRRRKAGDRGENTSGRSLLANEEEGGINQEEGIELQEKGESIQ